MDIVLDANILFAILIKEGKNEDLVFHDNLHIFVPEFIFDEFEKYKELILDKTYRAEEEFDELLNILRKRIKTIPNEETEKYLNKAQEISPDKNDTDYFALALTLDCAIWSNDKKLKEQNVVEIYSTEELIRKFEEG